MATKSLDERLEDLYNRRDYVGQQFNADDIKTFVEGIRDAREKGGTPIKGATATELQPDETPTAEMTSDGTLVLGIPKGQKGDDGKQGDPGEQGKSAYQVWLEDNGWTAEQHPVSEYLNSLKAHVSRFVPVGYNSTAAGKNIGQTYDFALENPVDGSMVLMPNADSSATGSIMFSVSVQDGVATYTRVGDVAIDISDFLSSSNVDGTALKNPTTTQVAKAADVMPLAAKLEGVTAVEDKLTVVDETTGQHIKLDNTTGTTASYKWGKFDVQGYRQVRFKGYVRGNGYSDVGFCFVDADNNWIDGYAYEYVTANVPSVQKEYVVAVPKGAVYLKTNTVAGTNMPASDFYCYGLRGGSVIDTINGWDEIEVGEELVSTLTVNNTRYLTLTDASGTENVFYDEGGSKERTKILKLQSNWKQLRITTGSYGLKVIFLKKEYNVRETITFDELQQGGYVCNGITSYNELFKSAYNGRCTHLDIPDDAEVAYFGIRQYQETTNRTPQSVVPIMIAEVHQGAVEKTITSDGRCNVELSLGGINPNLGGIINVFNDDRVALKTFISNPYKLNGCKIKSIGGANSGETLTIYMYNEGFAYLGNTTNIANVEQVKGCEYVLFGLTQDTAYTHSRRILSVTFSGSRKMEKSHWGMYRDTPYWVTFEVERLNNSASTNFDVDTLNDPEVVVFDNTSADYAGSSQRVYTTGYVILPPNYDRNGEPVPLAIFLHGTGGYTYGESGIEYYADLLKFVAKNGYAVVDCCTLGNIYSATTDLNGNTRTGYKDVNYPCRLTVDCYVSLYKYVTEMFNIDKDKVFAWGKSSGGRMAVVLGQHQFIPIKAIGILNGSTESLTTLRCMGVNSRVVIKKLMEDDLGITFPDENDDDYAVTTEFVKSPDMVFKPADSVSSDMIDFLLRNKDKMAGYNPMFIGISDFDIDAYQNAQFHCSLASDKIATSLLDDETDAGQTIRGLVAEGHRTSRVPTKLWAAKDDENVPYQLSVIYTALTKKGGGICELRTIPANNGKHWAVDIAQPNLGVLHPGVGFPNDLPTAPKTSYVTKFGEEVEEVTVTYAELVDWFNQW